MCSLPEFLREGSAVQDTLHPDRIVIGAKEPEVIKTLVKLHEPLGGARVIISPESAQMAKYTANAYLAQRITFINQIANLCERNGAKINEVIEAIGHDKRIGTHYWYPGLGYGGSCYPKDVKELAAYAHTIGEGEGLLPKIDALNEERISQKMVQFGQAVGGFEGKRAAVLGLSFKPNTDDTRCAPSLKVIPYLQENGADVVAYDPKVKETAINYFPGITLVTDPYAAAVEADLIFILVEWEELRHLDLKRIKELAKPNCWLIDTRNQYQPCEVEAAGLHYLGIGSPRGVIEG
jgi:UDPglucose 6-dehydrogenase